ncbi:MAG: Methyltransferase [Parcubacteria group bacterium GW2011_GWA2_48_9]|nr:MAG: Methyltransferase [Parcubacteria group bacterium GW2011_GWA2_48_9]
MVQDLTYKDNPELYEEVENIPGEKAMFSKAADVIALFAAQKRKPNKRGISILDLCCGTAPLYDYLLKHDYPNLHDETLFDKITGVDISPKYLEYAQIKYNSKLAYQQFDEDKGVKLEFILHDAVDYNHSEKVDLILASSAYHHIEDERKIDFLKKVHSQLKDDGIAVFCENLIDDYSNLEERAISVTDFYTKRIDEMRALGITDRRIELVQRILKYELDRDYEWKNSYNIFMKNLGEVGFKILGEYKVWPSTKMFENYKVGDFVIIAGKK